MNLYSVEFWVVALLITIVLLAGFGIFARSCALGPAVPRKKLDALCVGMTTDEVAALLGRAREIKRHEKGMQFWRYGSQFKRHVLIAEFDASGKLQRFVHGVPDMRRPGHIEEG